MFRKVKSLYQHIRQTIEEGSYGGASKTTLWSHVWDKAKSKLPESSPALTKTVFSKMKAFSGKILWASVLAAISFEGLAWAALSIAAGAAGFATVEYVRCRKRRNDIITEKNFLGQTVRGRRRDLCRLAKAQEKILDLDSSFYDGETPDIAGQPAKIQSILDTVKHERKRVRILDAGGHGGRKTAYDFSTPQMTVAGLPEAPAPVAAPAPAPADAGLKEAWQNRRSDAAAGADAAPETAAPSRKQVALQF